MMYFAEEIKPSKETKMWWMRKHEKIIPSCFDDGRVGYMCRLCRFSWCNNYRRARRMMAEEKRDSDREKALMMG